MLQPNQQVPEGFSKQVLRVVHEHPLCPLYAKTLYVNNTSIGVNNCSWCLVIELIACYVMLQPNHQLPEGFSKQVFGAVYEQPLCSVYASRDNAGFYSDGFSSTCDSLPTHCARNATWCAGDSNPDAEAIEEIMALQLFKVGRSISIAAVHALDHVFCFLFRDNVEHSNAGVSW